MEGLLLGVGLGSAVEFFEDGSLGGDEQGLGALDRVRAMGDEIGKDELGSSGAQTWLWVGVSTGIGWTSGRETTGFLMSGFICSVRYLTTPSWNSRLISDQVT